MFVRNAVSGVRSSWLASSTRRRCCSRDVRKRAEHAVEARREVADLVAAADVDRVVEVLRGGDVGRGVGQVLDRPDDTAGDEPRERRRQDRAGERDEQQSGVERAEHVLVGLDAAGDLDGAVAGHGDREHPVGVVVQRDVRGTAAGRRVCAMASVLRVDRQGGLAVDGVATFPAALMICVMASGSASGGAPGTAVIVGVAVVVGEFARRGVGESRRSLQEELVGLRAELLARAQVCRVRATDDHERERDRDDQRQPEAQAHAARSV